MRSTDRCERLTQSSRLRSGAASAVSTCMSTPSVSPTMPRGSRTPRSPSSEKPTGSEWTTCALGLQRLLARRPPSTRLMSASSTSWPPRLIVAEKVSLFSRPAETLTISEVDRQPGHALGRIDGQPDRLLGAVEVDDHAGLHAARLLVADADDLRPCGCGRGSSWLSSRGFSSRDHAADLARTDIEHGDDAGPLARAAVAVDRQASSYLRSSGLLAGLARSLSAASRCFSAASASAARRCGRQAAGRRRRCRATAAAVSRVQRDELGQRLLDARAPAA